MNYLKTIVIAGVLFSSHMLTAETMEEKNCRDNAGTQMDLNRCAFSDYKKADAELNRVYKQLQIAYKKDALFLNNLKQSQRAWIKLRDADFALKYPHSDDYGSIFPLCASGYKRDLTLQRVEFLKQWLVGSEEGEVCRGSVKLR